MGRASLITGPERRRYWSEEQKRALLTAAFGVGGSVAEVARRADICTSLLYRWRQAHRAAQATPGFVPAVMTPEAHAAPSLPQDAAIVVELTPGVRVKIGVDASPALVEAALRALR